MNDITRKFIDGILQKVDEHRIVELRLFPAMRQGGVESAVAVLAVEPRPEAVPDVPVVALTTDEAASDEPAIESDVHSTTEVVAEPWDDEGATEELTERMAELRVTFEGAAEPEVSATASGADEIEVPLSFDAEREVSVAATADAPVVEQHPDDVLPLADILALPEPEPNALVEQPDPRRRLEIISARYRYVFKGPERGKWIVEVIHEADAPFETLERVVNGVVRRSGEESDPERYSAVTLREALNAPAWA